MCERGSLGTTLEELTLAKAQRSQSMDENRIGTEIVDAAIAVHRELGPGLLESVYEVVLSVNGLPEVRLSAGSGASFREMQQLPIPRRQGSKTTQRDFISVCIRILKRSWCSPIRCRNLSDRERKTSP